MASDPGRRIRILLLGWTNSPHVAAWAQRLVAIGHEVTLAGRDAPDWPSCELPAGLRDVHRVALSGPPGVRGRRLSGALGRVAARVRPDLCHAHWLSEFGWIAAREGLRPLVSSAWGSDVLGAGRLGRARSGLAIEASDLVLADSEPLAAAVRGLARSPAQVEVARWGVDLTRFRPAPGGPAAARGALGLPEAPTILGMRALSELYNPTVVLHALARVRRRLPAVRLLLKHPETRVPATVTATIERLGLAGAVTVMGHVEAGRLPDVYRAAEVAISVPSSDSSPASVWEALASATPTVVSDLPWARAELRHGEHACLVAIGAAEVADAVSALLDDPRRARAIGAAGRRLAERAMDPAVHARRVDELYRRVLARAGVG